MSDTVIHIGDDPATVPDALPVLADLLLDLPAGARLNPDGSVWLPLEYPVELTYRRAGTSDVVKGEAIDHLLLRRLTGKEACRVLAARKSTEMAVALSSGLGPAKYDLVAQKMDATDLDAAESVVGELLGGLKPGLPERAVESAEAVTLPLIQPVEAPDGSMIRELVFNRLTGADRRAIADAPDPLVYLAQRALGRKPKDAKEIVETMDGADAVAIHMVRSFLSRSGQRTGR